MYIECGGNYIINGKKVFGRKIFINPSEIGTIAKTKFNNVDAYCTNYLYEEENQNNSNLIGPLYIDLDGDIHDSESYNKVKADALMALTYFKENLKVPVESIRIYFSGSKGFHLIIPSKVFGIMPCKDLNDKYKKIALNLKKYTINKTVDTAIYDKKRLIRIPHTINSKSGLYKVPLTESNLRLFEYDEMMEYAKTDKDIEVSPSSFNKESRKEFLELTKVEQVKKKRNTNTSFINKDYEIPLCIKYIFTNGADQGQRNNTLIVLASALLQKGMELEDCIQKMQEWNQDKVEPSLREEEVENTVRSAFRGLADGRRYGCTSIRELGICIKQCKLNQKSR